MEINVQPAKAIALIATSFIVGTFSTAALAVSKRTAAMADKDVKTLLHMMDKDQNGVVSKDEFIQFMSDEFDRLDVNKSSTLEPNELRPLVSPWPLSTMR
jgi:hypothetical protein